MDPFLPCSSSTYRIQIKAPALSHRYTRYDLYASGKYVWVGTPQEWVLKPILVFSPNQKERLKVFPEALYDPETNAVHILQTGENLSLHERISRKEPGVLSILWKNIAYFSKLISPARIFDSRALLYSTSFILFLVSLHTVLRSSRWILFNFILALLSPYVQQEFSVWQIKSLGQP
jgi:hypothetical protein